jgi:hypothetical protein
VKKFYDVRQKPFSDPNSRIRTIDNAYSYIKLARIIRVDYERCICDFLYLDGFGGEYNVPIGFPFIGSNSFMGSMPSLYDVVMVGYLKDGNFGKPIILGYFPRNYKAGLNLEVVPMGYGLGEFDDTVRHRYNKIYPGEINISSSQASEIILDKSITISNSKLNEIILDSSEQSISFNSISTYINNSGIRINSGLIHRNNLIDDPDYQFPNKIIPTYINENGAPYYTVNFSNSINSEFPYGRETINEGNSAFTEHRIEISELADPRMPVTRSNSGFDSDLLYQKRVDGNYDQPSVIQVLGTLVGNDSVKDKSKYGIILKPKLFPNSESFKGVMSEEACVATDGLNETISLAAIYTLKFPNSGTAFYVNKQGKYFANIASSTSSDTLGSGESAEINITGHSKIFMGKNANKQRSLSLNTSGGVLTNWGFDNDKNRSWDATFRRGVSWNILGNDKDDVALSKTIEGNVRTVITGSRYTEITGNDVRLVYGVLEDKVLGKKVDNFVNDKATNYGGKFNENSVGHYSQVLSSGKSVTINAPDILAGSLVADKTEIRSGNSEFKMFLGSRKESLLLGNHETSLVAGNKSVSIIAGNYKVSITAGNISIKTIAGSVDVGTTAGTVKITGSLGVTVESVSSIKLKAPKVDIGGLPVRGGIVNSGPAGHKDYLTGLPLVGSSTCSVNSP